jgi:hypothetical protein
MANKLANCLRCGEAFMSQIGSTCPGCLGQEEREFCAVRAFLEANPKTPTVEVAVATGVPATVIMKFVRSGRLSAEVLPADMISEWLRRMDAAKRLESSSGRRMLGGPVDRVQYGARLVREGFFEHKKHDQIQA